MIPDWKDAPRWANYLAMDDDGEWWWYMEKPILQNLNWIPGNGPCKEYDNTIDYKASLQERPLDKEV